MGRVEIGREPLKPSVSNAYSDWVGSRKKLEVEITVYAWGLW